MATLPPHPTLIQQALEAVRWNEYERALREKNRYVPKDQSYFDTLVRECLACAFDLPAASTLYRARIMPPEHENDTEPLPITQMGQPPADATPDGRVNPAGIPCFYAALEPDTAIAELRPWPVASLSVATFTTARALSVLDLLSTNTRVRASSPLWWVAYLIGRPVHRDDRFGYLGTQYLAERLKAEGATGLLYASQMKPGGTNVALFSDSGLKPEGVSLHKVTAVKYTSRELVLPRLMNRPLPPGLIRGPPGS